jgi:hypothetical protein
MNAAEQSLIEYLPIFNAKRQVIDHAAVDTDDFELLDEMRWHLNGGYVATTITIYPSPNRLQVYPYLHRIIMNAPDGMEVDHINHDKLDNRKSNLRLATGSQNNQNRLPKPGKIFKGFSWRSDAKSWAARIWDVKKPPGKRLVHLGYFKTEIEAAAAYNAAARELFGEFAYLNQIP